MSNEMTEDQQKRIEATLRRIRDGLSKASFGQFSEPSHIFDPEVHNGKAK